MKRIFLTALLTLTLFVAAPVSAATYVQTVALKDTSGTAISSYNLTNQTAVYSKAIFVGDDYGVRALLVAEDKSGGAGDVDISIQYSTDGTNFYDAYTTSNGTLTVEANIVTTLQNATRYIVFTARIAPYVRFKFDPDADSRVTASFVFLKDR